MFTADKEKAKGKTLSDRFWNDVPAEWNAELEGKREEVKEFLR